MNCWSFKENAPNMPTMLRHASRTQSDLEKHQTTMMVQDKNKPANQYQQTETHRQAENKADVPGLPPFSIFKTAKNEMPQHICLRIPAPQRLSAPLSTLFEPGSFWTDCSSCAKFSRITSNSCARACNSNWSSIVSAIPLLPRMEFQIPVVPHKAVAEVSKIGNL